MNDMPQAIPTNLEEIAQRKEALSKQIHIQKKVMAELTKEIFSPLAPATDKTTSIMRAFNTGMAVWDGALLGWKLIRKFKKLFRKRAK